MTLPNHLLGGAVFTGVFAATISGANRLASPWHIAVAFFAHPDIDMTLPFLIALSSLMILRYVGRELGDEDTGAYKLIGGAALLFLLFGRPFFAKTKRKYV